MIYIEIIGFLAGGFGLVSFVPQVIKSWKTKSTDDLSLLMYITLIISAVLWSVYGFLITSYSVIIVNMVVIALQCVILYLKIKYG